LRLFDHARVIHSARNRLYITTALQLGGAGGKSWLSAEDIVQDAGKTRSSFSLTHSR